MWLSWMQDIEKRLKPLASTSFEYLEPEDLSNKATRLRVKWDANVLKITGPELVAKLDAGNPAHPDRCRQRAAVPTRWRVR